MGIIQKYIDNYIDDNIIKNNIIIWGDVKEKRIIESQKSAIIGQIYGGARRLLANINSCEEEELTDEDGASLNDVFKLRLIGIETRVNRMINETAV